MTDKTSINWIIHQLSKVKNYKELSFYDRKRSFDILVLCSVGIIFFTILSILALLRGSLTLAIWLFLFDLTVGCFIWMIRQKGFYSFQVTYFVLFSTVGYFYLLVSGGYQNTGILWCYIFSPLMYTFVGYKHGFIANFLLISASATYFWITPADWQIAQYSFALELRYILAYFCLSLLLSIKEYSRAVSDRNYRHLSNHLRNKAYTDPLTGTLNRRGMDEALDNFEIDIETTQGSLLMIDIDYFKKVNDEFGHSIGDQVLQKVGQLLLEKLRSNDVISRWGGEEFLVLLTEISPKYAEKIAEKLRYSVEHDQPIKALIDKSLTVSIGVVHCHKNKSMEYWLDEADQRLYEAKNAGRNKVVC